MVRLFFAYVAAWAASTAFAQDAADASLCADTDVGLPCLVCNAAVSAGDVVVLHRGRRVLLHQGECVQHWSDDSATYFTKLQSRVALFDENALAHTPLHLGWLALGVYVFLGLIFAGACGYLAITRGQPPLGWFFAGLVGNVAALLLLLAMRRPSLADVPPGLCKAPATSTPIDCPACGAENHPAARACSTCGVALQPSLISEAARVGDASC